MNIQVARGEEARQLLDDDCFLSDWSQLQQKCPWASSFQSPFFIKTWYDCYRLQYEPMLLLLKGHKTLNGLLALAVSADGALLVNAGARQAEYHSWICLPELSARFPEQALQWIGQHFRNARLVFKYLPPGTPVEWLQGSAAGRRSTLASQQRPLLRFGDGNAISSSLRKKSNRSKVNRLKRIGPLEFRRIVEPDELQAVFDEIVDYYDFRQVAVHDSLPFRDDQHKRVFHLDLLNSSGLLHVTVLQVGGQIASAMLGIASGKELQLGIIAHNPFLGAYSPGKLHVLFLAERLGEEGFKQLDLTPGGDAYKERFANAHDEVFTLTVHSSVRSHLREQASEATLRFGRRALKVFGTNPKAVKQQIHRAGSLFNTEAPLQVFRSGSLNRGSENRQLRIYRLHKRDLTREEGIGRLNDPDRDNLHHLLSYRPGSLRQGRKGFFSTALTRIESGAHFYTCLQNDCLLYCVWLSKVGEKACLPGLARESHCPAGSVLLFGFESFSAPDESGSATCFWRKALSAVADDFAAEWIYTSVSENDDTMIEMLDDLGFSDVASLS